MIVVLEIMPERVGASAWEKESEKEKCWKAAIKRRIGDERQAKIILLYKLR